ncbi:MAG: hypothetical protein R3B09_19265 [Nannocystaceae bacterium]
MSRRRLASCLTVAVAVAVVDVAASREALASEALASEAPAPEAPEPSAHALAGDLRRAGDRTPLVGVAVLAYPADPDARLGEVRAAAPPAQEPAWLRRAVTDDQGAFVLDDLPAGRLAIEVVTAGYLRARWIVDVPDRRRPLRLFLRPEDRSVYRTVVHDRVVQSVVQPAPSPARRVLSREEVRTIPGSQGDPLRAIQSLPGVARAPFGLGLLVLRGASPRTSQVFVGDHPVPYAFHLTGLTTVLRGEVIDDLAFVPSNFDPRYGNASGGLITLTPRAGRRDGYHGDVFLDLGGVGAMAEGPVGKGSFLVAARRSHLDLPLRVNAALQKYAYVILPNYADVQVFYDRPLRRRQHLHVGFLGADDRLAFKTPVNEEGERLSTFETRSSFYRVDLAYRGRVGATSFLLTPAFRVDTHRVIVETMDWDVDPRRSYGTTLRAQIDHPLSERVALVIGADADLGHQSGDTRMRPYYGSVTTSNSTTLSHDYLGLYSEAIFRGRSLTLVAGSRFAAFFSESGRGFAVDPRLRARAELGERWTVSAAAGVYSQPWIGRYSEAVFGTLNGLGSLTTGQLVLPDQIVKNFDPTVPSAEYDLRVLRSHHASLGAAVRLDHEVDLEATAFVRDLRDPGVQIYEDPVGGLAFGGEFLVRKRLVRRLYGWIAYTLMWARQEEYRGATRILTLSPYDQRHNLVAVMSLRLPRDWQIGARFRLSSGLPYTPIQGGFGSGNDYTPLKGPPLSDRFPIFHQLDVRVDKRWVLRRTIVAAYLDVLNAYNYGNTEAYLYSSDYQRRIGGLSLPILPIFGVRVEI